MKRLIKSTHVHMGPSKGCLCKLLIQLPLSLWNVQLILTGGIILCKMYKVFLNFQGLRHTNKSIQIQSFIMYQCDQTQLLHVVPVRE